MTTTEAKPFKPAKRGDMYLIARTDSVTYAFGSGRGTERKTVWIPAEVTSVTRDGRVKAAERPETCAWPWKIGSGERFAYVISADILDRPVREILADLSLAEFANLDDARTALARYKRA